GKTTGRVGRSHSFSHIQRHPSDNLSVHRPRVISVRGPAKAWDVPVVLAFDSSLAELVVKTSGP
ncbi:MAG: hypothetical protein ACRDL5_16415, partial [Solirubrobacteraceae bacterium]